jgi:hypothetical protein
MFPKLVKRRLNRCIAKLEKTKDEFVQRPGKDFTRNRKLSFKKLIEFLIVIGSGTQTKELLDFFNYSLKIPTSSAFIQQRDKLKPSALLFLLHNFVDTYKKIKTFKGYRLIAVDGSKVTISTDPNHKESYVLRNGNTKGYNLLHINALYDICNKLYLDATIQTYRKMNEFKALVQMIKRSKLSKEAILIADRGYESYNNIAHLENKGWNYVIRVKAPNSGTGILSKTDLPTDQEFDEIVSVLMTRRQTNEIKSNPKLYRLVIKASTFDFLPLKSKEVYPISFRVVCIKIDKDNYQYLITNLVETDFSMDDLKAVYCKRWGVEISFRELKYGIAMIHFNSKKVEHIKQEIFAKMILYNFCEMITLNVVIEQDNNRKYTYQVNFTNAMTICIKFLKCYKDRHPPHVEALIKKYILPIREGRNFPRQIKSQPSKSFFYRVA